MLAVYIMIFKIKFCDAYNKQINVMHIINNLMSS